MEIDIILSPKQAQSFRDRINKDGTDAHAIDEALAHVQSENAEASVQADLDAIRVLIQKYSGGFGTLNDTVKQYLRRWFVSQGGVKVVARKGGGGKRGNSSSREQSSSREHTRALEYTPKLEPAEPNDPSWSQECSHETIDISDSTDEEAAAIATMMSVAEGAQMEVVPEHDLVMSVAAGSTGSLVVPATVHSNADRMMADPEVAADHSDPPDTQVGAAVTTDAGVTPPTTTTPESEVAAVHPSMLADLVPVANGPHQNSKKAAASPSSTAVPPWKKTMQHAVQQAREARLRDCRLAERRRQHVAGGTGAAAGTRRAAALPTSSTPPAGKPPAPAVSEV